MGSLGNVTESLVIVMVVVCVAGQDSGVRKVNAKEINKHSITEIYILEENRHVFCEK